MLVVRFDMDKIYSDFACEIYKNIEKYVYSIYGGKVKVLMIPDAVDIEKEKEENEWV